MMLKRAPERRSIPLIDIGVPTVGCHSATAGIFMIQTVRSSMSSGNTKATKQHRVSKITAASAAGNSSCQIGRPGPPASLSSGVRQQHGAPSHSSPGSKVPDEYADETVVGTTTFLAAVRGVRGSL